MRRRLILAGVILALLPATAQAQDLNAEMAEARAQETGAQAAIAAAEPRVEATEHELLPIAARTREAVARANTALERVDQVEEEMIAQRKDAALEVAALEAAYREDKDEHDEATETALGIGFGSALLALIPFLWGRFRELSPARRLAGRGFGRTLAWVGCGAFIGLLIGGSLLGSSGLAYVLGGAMVCLTIGLAAALVIARHSLRVESGEATPLLSRDRLPRWAALVLAALLLLLGVGALGDGVLSSGPEEPEISDELRQLAEAAREDPADPPTEELIAAQEAADPLVTRAEKLREPFHEAKRAWLEAKNELTAAKNQLREAQRDVTQLTSEIEAQAEQAALAAARAAERAERQAARQAAAAVPSGGGGTPSYSSCDTAPDNIPVSPGSDLDADGDGIGCET